MCGVFFRLVSENLEFQSISPSTTWTRKKSPEKLFIFNLVLFISISSRNRLYVVTATVCSQLTFAMEPKVWCVREPQLSGQWQWRGWTAGVVSGGFAPQPQVLPTTQRWLSGRGNLHWAVPGCAEQSHLGSSYHPQLHAGWLVLLHDAPGSGRGCYVQSYYPSGSEAVPFTVSPGTQVCFLHWPES